MSDRRGFTLIEMLVVAVLGAFVLVATYNVLITNQRAYTINTAQIQGQQTVRAGMDLLFSELREISPAGGDLLGMDSDTVAIRVMRSAALVCDTAWSSATEASVDVVNMGDTIADEDSVWIYIEHDPGSSDDDEWAIAMAQYQGGTTCQTRPAQTLTFAGHADLWDEDTLTLGSLIRTWTTYTYGLGQVSGEWYLVRNVPGGAAVPLVGPVRPPAGGGAPGGVSFEYLDEDGNVTAVAAEVAQIVVTLRTISEARNNEGNLIADSLSARIFTRN